VKNRPGGAASPTLSFVGAGRAGSALAVAAHAAGYQVTAVASRRYQDAVRLAARIGAAVVASPFRAMTVADITLLTVPDGAITRIAATVAASGAALRGRAIVHVSARFGPDVAAALRLTGADVGVLHPLQALAGAESAPLLRGSYFRVEATGRLHQQLEKLVAALGGHVLTVDPSARDLYHAAAVLVGNAPLALLARASALLEAAGVEPIDAHAALAALLAGAADNARRHGPKHALTGPIVRGDSDAVAAHLRALEPYPDVRELYTRLAMEMATLAGRSLDVGEAAPVPLNKVA
jgi:predicted short-subunit dehydrogenase-like oxidoreductase (DUF2520 family)